MFKRAIYISCSFLRFFFMKQKYFLMIACVLSQQIRTVYAKDFELYVYSVRHVYETITIWFTN